MLARSIVVVWCLPVLACSGGAEARHPGTSSPRSVALDEAPATIAPPTVEEGSEEASDPPVADGALAIPAPWPTRALVLMELVAGPIVEVEESWVIGEPSEVASSMLTIRSRPDDRVAAFEAAAARLAGHDDRYSVGRTTVSARVDGMSVRVATPSFFPGQLDVEVAVDATLPEVVARCVQLAPLADQLAALDGWPAQIRGCSLARSVDGEPRANVRLQVDEAAALSWLGAQGFVERREEGEMGSRLFERGSDRPAHARWYPSPGELSVFVGEED